MNEKKIDELNELHDTYNISSMFSRDIFLNEQQFIKWNSDEQFLSIDNIKEYDFSFPACLENDASIFDNITELIFKHYKFVMIDCNDNLYFITKFREIHNPDIQIDDAHDIAIDVFFE